MSRKFERLLDYLVNEDMEKANALFHEIVVEKSRNIYESLMADAMAEEEDLYQEAFGGDPADDMVSDVVDPDMGMDDEDMDMDMDMDDANMDMDIDDADMGNEDFDTDSDMEDDISDIKDTLEELTAEFEALLGKIGQDDEFGDEDMDMDDEDMDIDMDDEDMDDEDMDDEDMDDEDMDDEDMDDEFDDEDTEMVREYREIVKKNPLDSDKETGAHTRSPINANPADRPGGGKVNAKNIAQSHTGEKVSAAAPKGKFVDSSTLNVDGKTTKGYHSAKKPASKESGVNSKPIVPK